MSFNTGSSSSLFQNNDDNYKNEIDVINAEEEVISRIVARNNNLVSQLLSHREAQTTRRGSIIGHKVINRGRENADNNLFDDYFAENSRYDEATFRRQFQMSRNIFFRIANAIRSRDDYFLQKRDAVGKVRLSLFQKITAVFRILAYGVPADSVDECIKIGESTSIECVKRFFRGVVEVFGDQYLRSPTTDDVARLLHIGKERGFPGMLGSLNCMHWRWKNFPTAWAGQYVVRSGKPTIILEIVADYDLWIWHAHFGMPGSNNDINVLEASNLFSNLAKGISPPTNFVIQGKEYNMGYYLADSIYPKLSTIVQTIHDPCRKDVERAFGVL